MNGAMKRHLGNISRAVGHDVTNKYSYIISSDDLTNAYVKMKDELGYPLMMDSKYRRAIVYNKKGLEKKIRETIDKCIIDNIMLLDRLVVEDIVTQLNGITQSANGKIVMGKNSMSNNTMNLFSNALVKGLVNGVGKIIDDITDVREK